MRLKLTGLVLFFFLLSAALSSSQAKLKSPALNPALEPGTPGRQGVDTSTAEYRSWNDDKIFNQLSGAKRSILQLKYGKKKAPGKPGQPVANAISEQTPPQPAAVPPSASPQNLTVGSRVAPTNATVNNVTADASALQGFTQTNSALVLGSGNTVVSSFYDSGSNLVVTADKLTGFGRSTDSGATFTDLGALPTNGSDGDGANPVLARSSSTGTVILSTLSFSTGEKLFGFRSTDNGATFVTPGVNLAPGFTPISGSQDKPWIACDNFGGGGSGNFYAFWRNFASPGGMTFTRSTNDGVSWGPSGGTVLKAEDGQGAQVAVGADHAVYCLWFNNGTGQQLLRKSTNQGQTFGPEITVATVLSSGTNGDLSLSGGFRSNTYAQLLASPTNANLLFCVFADVGTAQGDPADIYIVQSTDGGATWSGKQQVNSDGTATEQWQPALAVTPDGTKLIVSWYDRRLNGAGNTPIDYFAAIGNISGTTVTFGANFKVSSQSFPAVVGKDNIAPTDFMGDYDMAAADNSFFYLQWGDNRSSLLTLTNQPDVRFAKIPVAGPGTILAFSSRNVTGGNGNGFIEPNECNNLAVTIANVGTAAANNVTAILTTSTPNVTLLQNVTSFPDLAPGATSTNPVVIMVSTSAGFTCGTTINFNLTVNYTGGSEVITFAITTGATNYLTSTQAGQTLDLGTALVPLSQDDDLIVNIPLPFSYSFYGQSFTSVMASTNGNLQFSSNNNTFSNVCLPTTTVTDAILCYWDDLDTRGTGNGIFTSTTGTAPNRVFNIEWRGALIGTTTVVNFEVRLFEGQTRFECVYSSTHAGDGASATAGCQRSSGTAQTTFICNQAGGITPGLRVIYQLPPCSPGSGPCAAPSFSVSQVTPFATAPGKTITVKGTGFTAAAQVFFGGTRLIPAAAVTFVDAQTLTVTVPTSGTGSANINGYLTVRVSGNDATTQGLADNSNPPCATNATFPEIVLLGDTTGDGNFGTSDVALARAFTQFQATPTVRQRIAADVIPNNPCRGDGALNATDITFLRAVSFGQTQF
ncbi:MAG: hypothetical protein K1Y36_23185 [Blastocatellia bacterium]|nr:hypothetical protein [Blastocatellia bacterium]